VLFEPGADGLKNRGARYKEFSSPIVRSRATKTLSVLSGFHNFDSSGFHTQSWGNFLIFHWLYSPLRGEIYVPGLH
jgi:hypothetical protein